MLTLTKQTTRLSSALNARSSYPPSSQLLKLNAGRETSECPDARARAGMSQMVDNTFRGAKEQPGTDRWNEADGNDKKTHPHEQ